MQRCGVAGPACRALTHPGSGRAAAAGATLRVGYHRYPPTQPAALPPPPSPAPPRRGAALRSRPPPLRLPPRRCSAPSAGSGGACKSGGTENGLALTAAASGWGCEFSWLARSEGRGQPTARGAHLGSSVARAGGGRAPGRKQAPLRRDDQGASLLQRRSVLLLPAGAPRACCCLGAPHDMHGVLATAAREPAHLAPRQLELCMFGAAGPRHEVPQVGRMQLLERCAEQGRTCTPSSHTLLRATGDLSLINRAGACLGGDGDRVPRCQKES